MVPLNSFRMSGDRIIWLLEVVPALACVCICVMCSLEFLTSQCQCAHNFMVAYVWFLNNSACVLNKHVPSPRLVLSACTLLTGVFPDSHCNPR